MLGLPDTLQRNRDGSPVGYPCCDRRFPDPDPMFRHIAFEEGPSFFWDLPYGERSRRLRIYLLAVAAGVDVVDAWMTALNWNPEVIADVHALIDVENLDDERLEGLIARGAHPKDRWVRHTFGD